MNLWDEYRLSVYRELAPLSENHAAILVQDVNTRKLFVKKTLAVYDSAVFRYLQQNPIPNMPLIKELVEEQDRLIVVEEYLSGDTLQEILDRQGKLEEGQTIDYIIQLCGIIEMLHKAPTPIIHRDIKPSNIIISPDGVVKLLDINAAKMLSEEKTQDTVLLGTAGYAAPEQYGFGASQVETDIYAVGVMMNVLLTGDLPQQQLYKGRLATVIQNCTKLDWKSRYHSIREVAAVLKKMCRPASSVRSDVWYKKYALPGFRTKNTIKTFAATVGYLFVAYICLSVTISNVTSLELAMNRLCFFFMILSIIFFNSDYLGVRSQYRLPSSDNILIRWISILLVDVFFTFAWFAIMVILDGIL